MWNKPKKKKGWEFKPKHTVFLGVSYRMPVINLMRYVPHP